MGAHSQIGARRLLHSLIVHHEQANSQIANSSGLGGIFYFFIVTSLAISVPHFTLTPLDTGLSIDNNAVVANHEKLSP